MVKEGTHFHSSSLATKIKHIIRMVVSVRLFEPNAKETVLKTDEESQNEDVFPAQLSIQWRLNHLIPAFIGVVLFMVGSVVYYPETYNAELGGWAFTIGSAFFLYADLQEWWKNNRVGCFLYSEYSSDYENKVGIAYGDSQNFLGKYRRAENGLLFFCAALGSALYLIGSIFFIPEVNMAENGAILFIAAGAMVFFSHGLIAYREFYHNPSDSNTRIFKFSNILHDLPSFLRHTFAALGGAIYVVGSVYFLSKYLVDEYTLYVAVSLYVIGSVFYVFMGVSQAYRYVVSEYNYFH